MSQGTARILSILDACCGEFTFPMLDNGYVYLAAARLSLFRSAVDWAMVIELFGFSPRAGLPDTHIHTFSSRLPEPHSDSRFVQPVAEGDWQDDDEAELVAERAKHVAVRGRKVSIPTVQEYARHGIELEDAEAVQVFELCRYLAATNRNDVLATAAERQVCVPPELTQVLLLDEWHHPNVVDEAERPSGSPTFQQLAQVLVTGDVKAYRPAQPSNTHWRNWPDGGSL